MHALMTTPHLFHKEQYPIETKTHLCLKGQHRTALALQLLAPVCCLQVKLIQRLDAQQLLLTLQGE